MADLALIAATLTFFLLSIAYTTGCDRLGKKNSGGKK
jgi:hypothetical protein